MKNMTLVIQIPPFYSIIHTLILVDIHDPNNPAANITLRFSYYLTNTSSSPKRVSNSPLRCSKEKCSFINNQWERQWERDRCIIVQFQKPPRILIEFFYEIKLGHSEPRRMLYGEWHILRRLPPFSLRLSPCQTLGSSSDTSNRRLFRGEAPTDIPLIPCLIFPIPKKLWK